MAKEATLPNDKSKRRLAGRLFRYTFTFSVAAHLGVWALVGWPGDPGSNRPVVGPEEDRTTVPVTWSYEELPPPPSVEPVERPRMSKRPSAEGDLGKVPLPVPDRYAEADTIPDAYVHRVSLSVEPGRRIIVETPGPAVEAPMSASPDYVEFVPTSKPPALIYQSRPGYPNIARDSGVEGDVVLLVYIDARGDVRNAIVQSSPGLPALDEAAKKAAMKCKFKPAEQQGAPVGVWYSIVMEFRL